MWIKWMSNYIQLFYVDLITYPCHYLDGGLSNCCYSNRPTYSGSYTKTYNKGISEIHSIPFIFAFMHGNFWNMKRDNININTINELILLDKNGTYAYFYQHSHTDGLVKDCSISSALAMEILQSFIKLSVQAKACRAEISSWWFLWSKEQYRSRTRSSCTLRPLERV